MMAGMILISFALLGASFITLSYQYTVREKQDTIEKNAAYIAEFTGSYLSESRYSTTIYDSAYRQYTSNLAQLADAYVILCETTPDRIGEIVYSSDGQTEGAFIGQTLSADMVSQAVRDGSYGSMTTLNGLFAEKRFVAGCPIYKSGLLGQRVQTGMVFVAAEVENITEMWRAFANIFFFTAIVVLCLAFITTSVTSLRQTKPLKEMAEAARKFGHGEFETRVEVGNRQDEVGELAEAFNAMADSLAKSEAKRSEFVANISHELKTPMTTIAGFADGILDGTIPPEKERESLQVISSETRRLSRLVRRMLELSRLQSSERVAAQEQFDVAEVLLRVLVSLESKITEKDLDVQTQLPDGPVMVWGDPDAVTQVCYNLLDNAVKFSSPQGRLTLRITTKAGKAYIAIGNQGETIPPQQLTHIFDRFHKADSSRSTHKDGVGLGLYIVKTILNTYKEDITVTSQDGFTEFTFTLSEV